MAYDWPVRKAHMDDVKDIHALLLDCAQKGLLLPRALIFLYGHVRNFWVVEAPDEGFDALMKQVVKACRKIEPDCEIYL